MFILAWQDLRCKSIEFSEAQPSPVYISLPRFPASFRDLGRLSLALVRTKYICFLNTVKYLGHNHGLLAEVQVGRHSQD